MFGGLRTARGGEVKVLVEVCGGKWSDWQAKFKSAEFIIIIIIHGLTGRL